MFCELFDGYSSVFKYSFVSVDVAYFGGVADGVHVSWVVDSEWLFVLIL